MAKYEAYFYNHYPPNESLQDFSPPPLPSTIGACN